MNRVTISGKVVFENKDTGERIEVKNTINAGTLTSVLSRILNKNFPSITGTGNVIMVNGYTVNVTPSISGTTITWSGTLSLSTAIKVTTLALYGIVYAFGNSEAVELAHIDNTSIPLQAGTYTV